MQNEIVARRATSRDVPAIVQIGRSDRAFEVSNAIRFYENSEVEEWANSPRDNILLVLDAKGEIAGFLFCKIISSHWAMLDNFYVRPAYRHHGNSHALLDALKAELANRGISYLSTLVAVDAEEVGDYLHHLGFKKARTYDWHELFLKGNDQ